jgi:ribosomal protein S18 acetylase RimI-like enzyme
VIDNLPPGFTARRVRADDAKELLAVAAANNTWVIGEPDVTLEDIVDELTDPDLDIEHDLMLVLDSDQRAVAYGQVWPNGASAQVGIDFYLRAPEHAQVAPSLLRAVEKRAARLGADRGHGEVIASKGCYLQDTVGQKVMSDAGYAVTTTYHRMRRDLGGSERPANPAPGVTISRTDGSDDFRRAVYRIREEAFIGHHGIVPRSYEEWLATHQARSTTDWSQLWLAEIDGVPVATMVGDSRYVNDQNCGYVLSLATLPAYRGRGLGKALLHTYFADAAKQGRSGVLLGVDTQNATGALGLYESVGMRPVVSIQAWERTLPTR